MGKQASVCGRHREVALMFPHGRDQHGRGQFEKFLVKGAGEDRRIFHQMGHFLQQTLVNGNAPTLFLLQPAQLVENPLPAFLHIGDHPLLSEGFQILLRRRESHLFPQKPVSARPIAGGDACPGEGNRFPAEEADQPPHRPDKPGPAAPPAHRAGKVDGRQHAGKSLLQTFPGGFPLHHLPGEQVLFPFVFAKDTDRPERRPASGQTPPRRGSSFRPP